MLSLSTINHQTRQCVEDKEQRRALKDLNQRLNTSAPPSLRRTILKMDLYNLLVLSRHSFFRPIRRFLRLSRPSYQLWTDASGKGYGAHLGPGDRPIAVYQRPYLKHIVLRPPNTPCQLDLHPDNIQIHEATSLFLCLHRWKLLLRGSTVEAFTDNASIQAQYAGLADGPNSTLAMVDAIRTLAETEDINLTVTWIGRAENKTADRLSKLAGPEDPNYGHGVRMLLQMGKAGPQCAASLTVRKIMAADTIDHSGGRRLL